MQKIDPNLPIWQLTVAELKEILSSSNQNQNKPKEKTSPSVKIEYVYGINGLAKLLGCSKSHASKLKSEGIFDEAIIQNGRKIIVNKDKALELFNNKD
ncbi:DUF3853 family protein [Empedobacter stercoris]|uniref:DUF3853 family protein n=1 Tax=Empedobacter stercoris TaxID=1628248 RepID=UPI0021AE4A8C|nr:DUF3853 family protein [Empedobacter stercoris]UWX66175.1 DUF3853 family protein [Empedobacter stercoris]